MALTPTAELAVAHATHHIATATGGGGGGGGDVGVLLGVIAADALAAMGSDTLTVAVVLGEAHTGFTAHTRAGTTDLPEDLLRSGPVLATATLGAVSTLNDTRTPGTRWRDYATTAAEAGVRGVRAWPVQVGHRPVGALLALTTDPWGGGRDSSAGQTLADLCSVVLQLAPRQHRWAQAASYLQTTLGDTAVVHQAVGMLIAAHDLTPTVATTILATHATTLGITPHELATALVNRSMTAHDLPTSQHH